MRPVRPCPFFGPGYRRPLVDPWLHFSTTRRCPTAGRQPCSGRLPRIIARNSPAERIIKFTRETPDTHHVAAWQRGAVRIGEDWIRAHFIVSADGIVRDWQPPTPEDLRLEDLEPALAPDPDIIILGTGDTLLRPKLDLMGLMAERGVGLEIMSTPAACRTYNVLLHEGRAVVAALFIP